MDLGVILLSGRNESSWCSECSVLKLTRNRFVLHWHPEMSLVLETCDDRLYAHFEDDTVKEIRGSLEDDLGKENRKGP